MTNALLKLLVYIGAVIFIGTVIAAVILCLPTIIALAVAFTTEQKLAKRGGDLLVTSGCIGIIISGIFLNFFYFATLVAYIGALFTMK